MKRFIAYLVLIALLFNGLFSFSANADASNTIEGEPLALPTKSIDETKSEITFTFDIPKKVKEIDLQSIKVDAGLKIVPNSITFNKATHKLTLTIKGKKVIQQPIDVVGYENFNKNTDEKIMFTANPYNAVCRYSDGKKWQINTYDKQTFKEYEVDYIAETKRDYPPTKDIREVMAFSTRTLSVNNTHFFDEKGNAVNRSAVDPTSLRVDVGNILNHETTERAQRIVVPSNYDPKNPTIGVAYYMSTDNIGQEYLARISQYPLPVKSATFLTGDAGCWKYLVNYQYFISAKTLPQVIYEYGGTVSYKYVGYDTPTLTATLTADPTSVKYVGDDIEVDLILEGEVHNIEDPGVLKEYVFYVRLEEGTMISPIGDKLPANGKTKVKRTYKYTIPKNKLSSSSVTDYTEEFVGRIEARCNSSKYFDCSKLNSGPLKASTYVYKQSPIPTPTPAPSNTPQKLPPVAVIDSMSEVKLGDDISFFGYNSYDPDGSIEEYRWRLPNAKDPNVELDKYDSAYMDVTAWYDSLGPQNALLYVKDNDGLQHGTYHSFVVVPPTVEAKIEINGTLKENRKVTITDVSDSPTRYPVDTTKTKWSIQPVTEGISQSQIKYSGSLNGKKSFDVLFKQAGEYVVTLTVENTAGYPDTTERIFTIKPDESPIVDFEFQQKVYRDPSDGNMATFELRDKSYGIDGDPIVKRTWYVAYDANNDGVFDETKVTFNTGNHEVVTYRTNKVGKYAFYLQAQEEFGQPTIDAFVTASDRRLSQSWIGSNKKPDFVGEVLNLPPTVDFELKEKKKVDVIVDVGNTSKTVDEINSLVNTTLRPQLQAAGLDYTVQVEDSNEGKTQLYYFVGNQLYEYDLLTKSSKLLKSSAINGSTAIKSLYDPINDLIFKGLYLTSPEIGFLDNVVGYYPGGHNSTGFSATTNYQAENRNFISQSGYYYAETEGVRIGYGDKVTLRSAVPTIGVRESLNNNPSGIVIRAPFFHSPDSGLEAYYSHLPYFDDQTLTLMISDQGPGWRNYSLRLDTNLARGYEGGIGADPPSSRPAIQNEYIAKSYANQVTYFNESKEIIYVANYPRLNFRDINTHYSVFIYNPETKETRTFYDGSSNQIYDYSGGLSPLIVAGQENQLLYRPFNDSQWWYYEDYRDESTKKMVNSLPSHLNKSSWQTNIGKFMVFKRGYDDVFVFDPEEDKVYFVLQGMDYNSNVSVATYPKWYSSEKRYMSDVISEVSLRPDAEKYYIRIDDQALMQLQDKRELAVLASDMLARNITYIPLGNASNEMLHQRLLTTIDNRGRFIEGTDLNVALNQAAAMIANGKQADLHVLVAQSGQTDSAMKASVQQLVNELKVQNIFVTPHYYYGTSSSKLQEMYDHIKWNEEKNQYVLFLQTASMNDLLNEAYLEGAALTLLSNYAHYFQIGSSTNRSIAESLIALNEGKGKFYTGTSYSSYYADMKQTIIDTALQNPKRIKDVLVLQHDPITNEYSAEINVNLFYDDAEGDRKRAERFKTTHDPTVYENHTGVMDGTGQYINTLTTRFTKVGLYEMTMQAQDEPLADSRFSNYWLWSRDALSMLRLYVHREPVAKFKAIVQPNKSVSITDYSYDLDRQSRHNRGIVEWEWKWKKVDDLAWTTGQLTTVDGISDYFISLRVKDLDGAWSKESIQLLSKIGENQPPVALFSINPASASHRGNAVITDHSYDPDGDALIKREWVATKDGQQLWNSTTQPTKQGLQNAATAKGLSHLGSYHVQLRVTDVHGSLSDWHTEWMEVLNYPPVANFEDVPDTYRDSLNALVNTTVEPDPDGDPVSYTWSLLYNNASYSLGSGKHPSFTIKNVGLGKAAVGEWQIRLVASDPYGASSMLTKTFQVVNRPPVAVISSAPSSGYIDEKYSFISADTDPDSDDVSSLQSIWRITTPSGKVKTYDSKNLMNLTFDEKGKHLVEHWAVDQLGAVSEVVTANITILNKLPIADFTRSPITTYRGVDIDFKSLGTDYDGWIEGYRYELMRPGNTPLTISTEDEFTRSFSSLGTFNIRHTVTDNDGASASITKPIHIVNRPPQARVTTPSGSTAATATQFNTLTPIIRWMIIDEDLDPQTSYQLRLKSENGALLRTTPITTSGSKQFMLPNGWITEGPIYRVTVRVFDGSDWSEYAPDKYFNVQLNQPPQAGFTYSPEVIYEGDHVKVQHNVSDPDNDTLTVRYEVTAPNGTKSYYPSASTSYSLTSSQYKAPAFQIQNLQPGIYSITQTVDDGKSPPITSKQSFTAAPLTIVGQVSHTELWEGYRQEYNAALPANSRDRWEAYQFYSGERFMLTADTTLSPNASGENEAFAVSVTATLSTTGSTVDLSYEGNKRWGGSMWEESFSELDKGKHNIVFQVTYSNGVIKQHSVEIEIIGKAAYWSQVQRWK